MRHRDVLSTKPSNRRLSNRGMMGDIKRRLSAVHKSRLKGVVLYGSQARGQSTSESDIDILVLLKGPVRLLKDLRANIKAVYPLSLKWGRPISPKPVDEQHYRAGRFPLYRRAHDEGMEA